MIAGCASVEGQWKSAQRDDSVDAYRDFIKRCMPDRLCPHVSEAYDRLEQACYREAAAGHFIEEDIQETPGFRVLDSWKRYRQAAVGHDIKGYLTCIRKSMSAVDEEKKTIGQGRTVEMAPNSFFGAIQKSLVRLGEHTPADDDLFDAGSRRSSIDSFIDPDAAWTNACLFNVWPNDEKIQRLLGFHIVDGIAKPAWHIRRVENCPSPSPWCSLSETRETPNRLHRMGEHAYVLEILHRLVVFLDFDEPLELNDFVLMQSDSGDEPLTPVSSGTLFNEGSEISYIEYATKAAASKSSLVMSYALGPWVQDERIVQAPVCLPFDRQRDSVSGGTRAAGNTTRQFATIHDADAVRDLGFLLDFILGGGYPVVLGNASDFAGKGSFHLAFNILFPRANRLQPALEIGFDGLLLFANKGTADHQKHAVFSHYMLGVGWFIPIFLDHSIEVRGRIGGYGLSLGGDNVADDGKGFTLGGGLAWTVPLINPDHDLTRGFDLLLSARADVYYDVHRATFVVPALTLGMPL